MNREKHCIFMKGKGLTEMCIKVYPMSRTFFKTVAGTGNAGNFAEFPDILQIAFLR